MTDPDLLSGVIVFLLLSLIGVHLLFLTWLHRNTLRQQVQLFITAFAIRFAVSVAVYSGGLINILKDEDGSGWVVGVAYHQQWVRQGVGMLDLPAALSGAFVGRHAGYYYLLGAFFHIGGFPTRYAAAALNCFFGALTIVFTYRLARTLFSEGVAARVGWWTCLFPSLVIWSAQTIKEPVVILLETLAIYCCVRLRAEKFSVRHLVVACTTIILLVPFRFYAAYITGVAVVLSLALPNVGKRRLTLVPSLAIGALLGGLIVTSGILVKQEATFGHFGVGTIQQYREGVSKGTGSGVESTYDLHSSSGFATATTIGAAHLLFAPFPWQMIHGSSRMLLTTPEVLVWWWLFWVGILPGIRHAIRTSFNEVLPLFFFIVTLGVLCGAMFGNVGTAYRQRAQLIPWLTIFAAVGLEQRRLRHSRSLQIAIPAALASRKFQISLSDKSW